MRLVFREGRVKCQDPAGIVETKDLSAIRTITGRVAGLQEHDHESEQRSLSK
jgi:hypothetical protein